MKKFSIKKRLGFAAAIISSCAVLAFVTGIGLVINQHNVEAATCTVGEPDCSRLTINMELVGEDGSTDIPADSTFQYKITVAASEAVEDVRVTNLLPSSVQYESLSAANVRSDQVVTSNYSGNNIDIRLGDLTAGQSVVLTITARAISLTDTNTITAENIAVVYSTNDTSGACTTYDNAQNYDHDNCTSSIRFTISSVQLQIDKTIDGNYDSYEDLHTGEEFLYTLKITNNAVGSYARDTITVYDEISPHLSNVRIVKIIYFNKLVEGLDDNNNMVGANPPICTISSQTMKCVFSALLYDETTSGNQILIQVAATPSAQYEISDTDAYTIRNEAFVYSPSDSYCKTLANAQEELSAANEDYIGISDGSGSLRSRCRSAIDFSVVQPQLSIEKSVSDDGKVWCTYKDSGWAGDEYLEDEFGNIYDPADHYKTKDISSAPDKEAACLNEYAAKRPPNSEETWAAFQIAVSEGKVGEGLMWETYQDFAAAYIANTANYVEQAATSGVIEDNSIQNGETLIYTLKVSNTGSGETKGDIIVTDQLDKNAFSDTGVSIQPLTGGVDCTVKDLLVTCVISRSLTNDPTNSANTIIIQIAAKIESAGTIYNSAYVGGGGDLKCPISTNGTMWCKSNEVSTYVTSPELHINKELRIGDTSCPSDGSEATGSETDDDACWSLGTTIVNGSYAKYVIKVTNEGTANTEGLIVIHDQIPDYLEVDRTTLSLKFDDGAYSYEAGLCEFRGTSSRDLYCRAYDTMEGGLMAKSGTWTIEFNVRVLQDADITKDNNRVINYAYVYGGGDAVCTNETIELSVHEAFTSGTNSIYDRCYDYLGSTIVSPKLNVTKTISSGQVQAGQPFKYKISVDNIGDHDLPYGTKVVDILPADITIDTVALPSGCEYDEATRRITCTINEKIVNGRPMLFELTATTTNATGTIVNKVLAYNKYDKDCQTELAATYTSRCHDIAVAQSLAPVLKVNMTTNVLDTYVGGQVEYRITVKNIGNMPTTETTTVNQEIPQGLRILGIRAQKGVCYPSANEIECEIPEGIKAGETVNISVLTQVTTEGDIVSDVNLYDGGDAVCSIDETETSTTSWFSTPVFAADTPTDVDDSTDGEDEEDSTTTDEEEDAATNPDENTEANQDGETLPPTITTSSSDTSSSIAKRDSRCHDSVAIRSYASIDGITGINDTGINSPAAGALSLLQAVGTVSLLGVASYGLLKFGFVANPVK